MDWFEREFKKYALIRGGIYFFKEEIALKLIKKCKELNKKILGIDTFLITEKKTQPLLEESIDYSSALFRANQEINKDIWLTACKFVKEKQNKNQEFYFEIVFE